MPTREPQERPESQETPPHREVASGTSGPVVIVAARNEEERIEATLDALVEAFPGAELIVADDYSDDLTARAASAYGIRVVSGKRSVGKGGNVTRAAETVLHRAFENKPPTFLLCDADLGASARELPPLVAAVERDECDLAIAAFALRRGGGFGVALGFARWAIERLCGYRATAPISGQRAMRAEVLSATHPFAAGYGMEIGITVDAARSGFRIREVELDLEHRATHRNLAGFRHRAGQLRDFVRVYLSRRR